MWTPSELFATRPGRKRPMDRNTICEKHRQIYDLLVVRCAEHSPELLEEVVPLLEQAYVMGMKMTRKLFEYKLYSYEEMEGDLMTKAERSEATKLRHGRHELLKELRRVQQNARQ